MLTSEIIAFSLFAWVCCFTPGPNVAIATATGVNFGVRAVVPHAIGVILGCWLMLWAVGVSGSATLQHATSILLIVKLIGIAYLLYLAWKLANVATLAQSHGLQALSVRQAVLFQIVNPKTWMSMLAATSTYAIGHDQFWQRMLWMSLGFAIPSGLSLLSWAWLGDHLRGWLACGQRLLMFNRLMAACLAVTAIWMGLQ